MTEEIKRAVGSIIVEVINSNPNGDPDRDGAPRQREDGRGEISDKSVKRKWRDFLENHDCDKFRAFQNIYSFDPERFHIFESRRRNWKQLISEISSSAEDYRETDFCRKYWDGRVFGNTILEKEMEKQSGKQFVRTGVIVINPGISISPVKLVTETFTRKAPVQEGKSRGMAPCAYKVVEHGVYVINFSVNAFDADTTGCNKEDIEMFKRLLPMTYQWNKSSVRSDIRIRHAWYVEYDNWFAPCPEGTIWDALAPKRIGDPDMPSRSWSDYEDVIDLPAEIKSRVSSVEDLAFK